MILEEDPSLTKKLEDELFASQINVEFYILGKGHGTSENFGTFCPDLILSDYSFLQSDLMSACLERFTNIQVVMVGSNRPNWEIINCLNIGMNDYLDMNHIDRLPVIVHKAILDSEIRDDYDRRYADLNKAYLTQRTRFAKQHALNEEERFHLAREIHDDLGQVLSALKIDISMLGRQVFERQPFDKVEAKGDYDEIMRRLERLTGTVKSILANLRPEILDELGVIEGIRWLVDKYKKNNNIKFEVSLPEVLKGDRVFPITLYRIVQATLTNIVRHTDATLVTISLKMQKDMLLLTIGCDGMEISKNEYKLMNVEIRERVGFLDGKLEVGARKPKGKRLKATIPFGKQLRMINYDKSYYSR
ncbi:MAG: histidine kinase [Marinoscillum sp.]